MLAVAGIASASALTSAMLAPSGPAAAPTPAQHGTAGIGGPIVPTGQTVHYVVLARGETAPPGAPVVVQTARPQPVTLTARTRQSGQP